MTADDRTGERRCDVLVVGGGINGTGIARDLAGRGLHVVLCEKDDLASHTSSSSTKLIHGGLRYLEQGQFTLVRKALGERETLLRSAPHIMRSLRFVMPHDTAMRPAWMIRVGLFLYDHLARREVLPRSETIDLRTHAAGAPLKPRYVRGFVYSDGWVDDARLVVLNAIDARERGATVLTRTACVAATRGTTGWSATLQGDDGAAATRVEARALVNATGPWAARFLQDQAKQPQPDTLRLVKGSHIVVRRRFDHSMAYLFQNSDRRIVFAIPYEGDFTLIGTTDVDHQGPIGDVRIDAAEIDYLCEQVNRYLARPVAASDVVWSYSGVRPLVDDEPGGGAGSASTVPRDYRLARSDDGAPLVTVWGGKITTYRKLAEEAATLVCETLGIVAHAWTARAALPGGDVVATARSSGNPEQDFVTFVATVAETWPWLEPAMRSRMARAYGSRIARIVGSATGMADLGAEVVPGLREAELWYLVAEEWATTADDVLWRRSKLGLHAGDDAGARLTQWFAEATKDTAVGRIAGR